MNFRVLKIYISSLSLTIGDRTGDIEKKRPGDETNSIFHRFLKATFYTTLYLVLSLAALNQL